MIRPILTPSILVAMPNLLDPNFQKCVILLTEHNDKGAMGFIVNKISETSIAELLPEREDVIPKHLQAWIGGPVDAQTALILKPEGEKGDSTIEITSSEKDLQDLIASDHPKSQNWLYPYRFIVGYAGWGPKQLDEEIRLGAWLEAPLDSDLLFNCECDSIWEKSLLKFGTTPSSIVTQPQHFVN